MPDNAIYYRLAYAATLVLYTAYAVSIVWRRARLARHAEGRPGGRA